MIHNRLLMDFCVFLFRITGFFADSQQMVVSISIYFINYLTRAVSSPKSDPVKAVVGAELSSCPVVQLSELGQRLWHHEHPCHHQLESWSSLDG